VQERVVVIGREQGYRHKHVYGQRSVEGEPMEGTYYIEKMAKGRNKVLDKSQEDKGVNVYSIIIVLCIS
jgi:hypothetical protein